jgi:hypothetical protein
MVDTHLGAKMLPVEATGSGEVSKVCGRDGINDLVLPPREEERGTQPLFWRLPDCDGSLLDAIEGIREGA